MKKSKEKMGVGINLTPISNNIITTANIKRVDFDNELFSGETKPMFLSVQQVVAKGPMAENVEVGDWIYLDMQRFVKHVKVKSQIKAGVGGQDMIKEEFIPPGWVAPGSDEAYFKLTDREIEGVITNYDELPEDMTDKMTPKEYEEKLMEITKETEALKKNIDNEQSKGKVFDLKSGPSVKSADGIYRQ